MDMSRTVSDILSSISGELASFLPKMLGAILVFLAFWVLAWVLGRIVARIAARADETKVSILQLLGSVSRVGVIAIGLVTMLGTLGINVGAMLAALGLTGFALGFALKDALSNLLAGVLILLYCPFRRGDKVEVGGCMGVVTNIDLRYTRLDAGDRQFLIPNSTCLTNWIAVSKTGTGGLFPDQGDASARPGR